MLVTRHVDTIVIAIYVPHAHEHHMTMACIVLLYRLNWCLVSSQKTYLIGFAQLAILFCASLAVILKERHTYDIAGTAEPGWRTIPGHPVRHSSNSVMKFLTCLGDATGGGGWKYACCSIYFNTKYHETVFIEGFFVLSNRWQIAVSSALRSWCRPRLAMREVRTETLHHSVTTHGQRCCRFVCFPNQRFSLVTQWNILFFLPSVNPTTKRGTFCLTARQWTLAVWRLHRQQSKRRPRRPPMVCRVCRCKMLQVCQISTLYCPQ